MIGEYSMEEMDTDTTANEDFLGCPRCNAAADLVLKPVGHGDVMVAVLVCPKCKLRVPQLGFTTRTVVREQMRFDHYVEMAANARSKHGRSRYLRLAQETANKLQQHALIGELVG
jgi:hypothetical protein